MKKDKVYLCKTEAQARGLLKYLDRQGLTWAGNSLLKKTNFRDDPEGTCYYIRGEYVLYGSKAHALAQGYKIETKIPGNLPLKEENVRDFKKMFRLNNLPDQFTKEQIEKMKSEKVYAKWIEK